MKRQLTFEEYRAVDLSLFALMLAFSEYVITSAATHWFPGQPFSVSITGAMCAIVLMRWGLWAGIHAVLGGAVYCFVSGATAQQYVIYCIGNLLCLVCFFLIYKDKGERIRKDKALTMLFGVAVMLTMQLGRAVIALAFGSSVSGCIDFFTTDALSILFAMVIVYIVRQQDGIFENQKLYLIRLQKQNEKTKGGF